jgi:8-amino-7-oxononanoate synthase
MNDSPIYARLSAELDKLKVAGLFRTPGPSADGVQIDLSTNSYLSLHANPNVAAQAEMLTAGCYSGNLASRLIETASPLYETLESELTHWKNAQSALVFNSGYAANMGIIGSLCTRDTEVFCDRLNHASIIDGILLSGATLSRYRHCDMADLAARLSIPSKKERIIITDSVFSMDGDIAPLSDICELARRHSCVVMVDEAHATGVFGKTLCGMVEECGVEDGVDVVMGTLSKAIAGLGGFFAGSELLRDCFINKARSLIYSTGLPHSVLAYNIAAIRHIRANPELGRTVREKAAFFRENVHRARFDTLTSASQIVPCLVESDKGAVEFSRFLLARGIKAPAIRPPTVPVGTSRIRFSISAGITESELAFTVGALGEWKEAHG